MQEAYSDGVDAQRFDFARNFARIVLIQLSPDRAGMAHPLFDLKAKAPFDQRRRLDPFQIVHGRIVRSHDFQHIPETVRSDKRGRWKLPLDQSIQNDRGAMNQIVDIGQGDFRIASRFANRFKDFVNAGQNTLLEVAGRRGCFFHMQLSIGIQQNQIGESTSDIGGKSNAHVRFLSRSPLVPAARLHGV